MGLENNIANSFLNAEVFLLWSLDSLRRLCLAHACAAPACVACELKFLFRMFDQGSAQRSAGIVVHAANFYRMLAHLSDSVAFGILDNPDCIPALYLRFHDSIQARAALSPLRADARARRARARLRSRGTGGALRDRLLAAAGLSPRALH